MRAVGAASTPGLHCVCGSVYVVSDGRGIGGWG